MPRNLSDKFCHLAKPPVSGRRDVSDSVVPGLQFRVSGTRDKPVKSWSVLFRFNGDLARYTLPDRFPKIGVAKARNLARHALELAGQGKDPREQEAAVRAAKREAEADTVRAAVDKFVATYASQRKWRDLERILRNEAVDAWGDRPVASVTRRDIIDRLDTIFERAPVRANRALTVFRLFFKWCRNRGLIEASPAADIDPMTVEAERDRVLTDTEIKAYWSAAEAKGWPFGEIYRLLLLTGCRRDEIGGLRWHEINADKSMLEIDGSRIKGGKPLVVPLSRPALAIVRTLPRIGSSAFVFPSAKNGDGAEDRPASGYGKAKILMDALMLADLQKQDAKAKLMPWRVHDLRRTCRSGLSRLQIPADIAELAIGHALTGVRKIYDRYDYLAERRDALDRWGEHVLDLVTPTPAAGADILRMQRRGRR